MSVKLDRAKDLLAKCCDEVFAVNKRWSKARKLDYARGLVPKCYGLNAKDVIKLHDFAESLCE